jgi:hypothetical protein
VSCVLLWAGARGDARRSLKLPASPADALTFAHRRGHQAGSSFDSHFRWNESLMGEGLMWIVGVGLWEFVCARVWLACGVFVRLAIESELAFVGHWGSGPHECGMLG